MQEAWIQQTTVRNNILFGLEMKPAYYLQVVAACALQEVSQQHTHTVQRLDHIWVLLCVHIYKTSIRTQVSSILCCVMLIHTCMYKCQVSRIAVYYKKTQYRVSKVPFLMCVGL